MRLSPTVALTYQPISAGSSSSVNTPSFLSGHQAKIPNANLYNQRQQGVGQPAFSGLRGLLFPTHQAIVNILTELTPLLEDTTDNKYLEKLPQPKQPFSIVERYQQLPNDIKRLYFDSAILSFRMNRRLKEGLHGDNQKWILVAEEFSDLFHMLAEQMLSPEKPFPMELPTLTNHIFGQTKNEFKKLFQQKHATGLRSSPDHFEQELQELFDEAKLSPKQEQKVRGFFKKKVITVHDVHQLEEMIGLPFIAPEKLMAIQFSKMDARERLRLTSPNISYNLRKYILKPFERLYITETLMPKTFTEKLVGRVQKFCWQLILPFLELASLVGGKKENSFTQPAPPPTTVATA